jgi:hypothetical protein
MRDARPFQILSPTSVKLSPLAREMAKLDGMRETQLAKHLLDQDRLRKAGLLQRATTCECPLSRKSP